MTEYVGSVSTKGQVTLPSEVRRQLGISPGDKVRIVVEDRKIIMRPAEWSLLAGYMSIPALKRPLTDEDITEIAEEEAVNDYLRDLQETRKPRDTA